MAQRALIIEDSKLIQRLVELCLRPLGLEIEAREDGRSGLEAALADPPDVLILDIGLPEMDGWEVLSRLRAEVHTRYLPILVLTAHAQEETRRRANQGGADHFMTKPFQTQELRSAVTELLNQRTGRGPGSPSPEPASAAPLAPPHQP